MELSSFLYVVQSVVINLQVKTNMDIVLLCFDPKGQMNTISPHFKSLKRHARTFAQSFPYVSLKTFISTLDNLRFVVFNDIAHSL